MNGDKRKAHISFILPHIDLCQRSGISRGARYRSFVMNKKIALTALVAMATLATVVPAEAQRRGGGSGPSLTLFTGVDYREQSVVITSNIADLRTINFDEAAGSLVARGEWQVCLDANYSSRCRIYSDAIPNLESFRGRISSVRYMGNGNNGGYGGGYGGGNSGGGWGNGGHGGWGNTPPRYNGQATTGRSTVFYPGSVSQGNNGGYNNGSQNADQFCRAQGNNSSVYAGQDRNGNLEDVLCRR
jgi:hypothetical protein